MGSEGIVNGVLLDSSKIKAGIKRSGSRSPRPLVVSNVEFLLEPGIWERRRRRQLLRGSGRSFQTSDHVNHFPQECLLGNIASHNPVLPLLYHTQVSAVLCHYLQASDCHQACDGRLSAPCRHKSDSNLRLEFELLFYSQLHNLCKGQSQMRERAWQPGL